MDRMLVETGGFGPLSSLAQIARGFPKARMTPSPERKSQVYRINWFRKLYRLFDGLNSPQLLKV